MMYHAQEKNVNVPGSPSTGKRGGILNSVTRVIVKPTNMVGGYVQLAYGFNYSGTVGCQRDKMIILHKIADKVWSGWNVRLPPSAKQHLIRPALGHVKHK